MSIQRYDYSGVLANIDVDEWVSYADHAAAVEDMRAAFIAVAYKTCGHTKYVGCTPCVHDEVAAALQEVKP